MSELTDRIMKRLGELWLDSALSPGQSNGILEYSRVQRSTFGPAADIRSVIYEWLIEEHPDAEQE